VATKKRSNGLSKHHLYYPSTWYVTDVERRFRNLPCNVMIMKRKPDHDLADLRPPLPKPTHGDMIDAINEFERGQCGCNHHVKRSYEFVKGLVIGIDDLARA
jgi:hypothetical protein